MNKLKRNSIFLLALCVLFAFHCSKKKSETPKRTKAIKAVMAPEIEAVTLEPQEPLSIDHIRAVTSLKKRLARVSYTYQWIINGKKVPGKQTKLLSAQETVKGDEVYCRVTAKRGSDETEAVDSNKVEIKNSRPVLNPAPVEPFEIPGLFQHQINAADPDNDTLTYKLVSPLDRGIRIEGSTGEISWDIEKPPVQDNSANINIREGESAPGHRDHSEDKDKEKDRFSPQVIIVFEVRDSDGASVQGSITLNLTQGSEVPQ